VILIGLVKLYIKTPEKELPTHQLKVYGKRLRKLVEIMVGMALIFFGTCAAY
jgi:hypothetical protein